MPRSGPSTTPLPPRSFVCSLLLESTCSCLCNLALLLLSHSLLLILLLLRLRLSFLQG